MAPDSLQRRYHLGFMGCYAAFPALRMAEQFCQANPAATVLVVCIELCSIHMQSKDDLDSLVANSVFADGLAAVLVSRNHPLKAGAAIPSTVLLPASPGRASRTWRGTSGIRASTSCSPNTSPGLSAQTSSTSWMMPFRAARELQTTSSHGQSIPADERFWTRLNPASP